MRSAMVRSSSSYNQQEESVSSVSAESEATNNTMIDTDLVESPVAIEGGTLTTIPSGNKENEQSDPNGT